MAIKKSQLYASLWQSCNELRGGMDASQYKDYILTLLFMKYVSDKAENDPNALIEVPEGGGFSDSAWTNGLTPENDLYNRFEYGIPPAKNGDYAFLLHFITSGYNT